jgi:hypothetical protein
VSGYQTASLAWAIGIACSVFGVYTIVLWQQWRKEGDAVMGWRSRLHKERAAKKAATETAAAESPNPRMPSRGGLYFGRGSDSTFNNIHARNGDVVMEDLTRCKVDNVSSTYDDVPPAETKEKPPR